MSHRRQDSFRLSSWAAAGLSCLLLLGETAVARDPIHLDQVWQLEPDLGAVWTYDQPPPEIRIDAQRLSAPERQTRLDETQKILFRPPNAKLIGGQAALEVILANLKAGEANRHLQLALVAAAIELSDGSHAAELWQLLRDEPAARPVVERALVKWQSKEALSVWRNRLSDPPATLSDLLTAIDGIAAVGDASDRPNLERLFRSDRATLPVRLAVSRALGATQSDQLDDLAAEILSAEMEQGELFAAHVLSGQHSPSAQQLLLKIMQGNNHPAQSQAFATLAASDRQQARELAEPLLQHADSNLRSQAVHVLDQFDTPESLRAQATALGDASFDIRCTVRENLLRKAELPELRPLVDEIIHNALHDEDYLAIEQAVLLAVALKQTEHCPQLVTLLEHPRPEASLRAAWGLQQLAESPEVLADILKHTQRFTSRLVARQEVLLTDVIRVGHLFGAIGRNRYQPASEMLMLYVPKDDQKMWGITRTAAIWALARIRQDSQDGPLARQLAQRMLDDNPDNPEDDTVRYASALALGYIGHPDSVAQLEKLAEPAPHPFALAKAWSLARLTNPPDASE